MVETQVKYFQFRKVLEVYSFQQIFLEGHFNQAMIFRQVYLSNFVLFKAKFVQRRTIEYIYFLELVVVDRQLDQLIRQLLLIDLRNFIVIQNQSL